MVKKVMNLPMEYGIKLTGMLYRGVSLGATLEPDYPLEIVMSPEKIDSNNMYLYVIRDMLGDYAKVLVILLNQVPSKGENGAQFGVYFDGIYWYMGVWCDGYYCIGNLDEMARDKFTYECKWLISKDLLERLKPYLKK